ncbi:MAG: hypothetical protein ACYTFT_04120 [Planctomycetota bacterium]|jgi:hypothetical protein
MRRAPSKQAAFQESEQGTALVAAVLFSIAAVGLAFAALAALPSTIAQNERHHREVRARYQTQGSIQRALHELKTGGTGNFVYESGVTTETVLDPGLDLLDYVEARAPGTVATRATEVDAQSYIVESAIHLDETIAGTGQLIDLSPSARYPAAIFLATTLETKNLATDSYSSSPSTAALGAQGHVFANGEMAVTGTGGVVSGDVQLGPGAALITSGVTYEGVTGNLTQAHDFTSPIITLPASPMSAKLNDAGESTPKISHSWSADCTVVSVGDNIKITDDRRVSPGEYVFGKFDHQGLLLITEGHVDLYVNDFHASPGAVVQISDQGSLTIHAELRIEIQGVIDNQLTPDAVKFVLSGPKSVFFWHPDSAPTLKAIIDADAGCKMQIDRDLELWGALRGGYVACKASNLTVHYDEALGSLGTIEDAEPQVLSTWYLSQ